MAVVSRHSRNYRSHQFAARNQAGKPSIRLKLSSLDPHSFPKSNFAGNVLRSRLWIRIVSGGVLVLCTVYDYVVIAGRALPSARRVMIAGRKIFAPHMLRRKVMVPLDNLGPIGLTDYFSVPYRSDHR